MCKKSQYFYHFLQLMLSADFKWKKYLYGLDWPLVAYGIQYGSYDLGKIQSKWIHFSILSCFMLRLFQEEAAEVQTEAETELESRKDSKQRAGRCEKLTFFMTKQNCHDNYQMDNLIFPVFSLFNVVQFRNGACTSDAGTTGWVTNLKCFLNFTIIPCYVNTDNCF